MYIKIYSIICMLWGYLSPGLGPIPIPNFSILHAENQERHAALKSWKQLMSLDWRQGYLHSMILILLYTVFFPYYIARLK